MNVHATENHRVRLRHKAMETGRKICLALPAERKITVAMIGPWFGETGWYSVQNLHPVRDIPKTNTVNPHLNSFRVNMKDGLSSGTEPLSEEKLLDRSSLTTP
jgi:hypothetical protein